MAEYKPLGSEKLNGDDKLKRILELTYFNSNKKSASTSKAELVKESKTGGVFGIVKEKDGYYVKRGLNESSLDYIGGMFMKNKNRFTSYSEAFKRLDLIKGQEELQEATKYVLKQAAPPQAEAPAPSPVPEAPVAEPSMDAAPDVSEPVNPSEPISKSTDNDMGMGDASSDDANMGGDAENSEDPAKRSDYMGEVQKYAGKLGQELRDLHDRMESDDIKYVLNMVISAVDLDKLDDEDIEEIAKKFERDEEGDESDFDGDMPSEDAPSEEPSDAELGEEAMNALDEFIESPAPHDQTEVNLDSYMPTEEAKKPVRPEIGAHGEDHLEEIDLDEIKNNISQAIGETLSKYFKH